MSEDCERCARPTTRRRYRCVICARLVCADCCESLDRTQGQRRVWCSRRDALGERMPDDCKTNIRELAQQHERGETPREEEAR